MSMCEQYVEETNLFCMNAAEYFYLWNIGKERWILFSHRCEQHRLETDKTLCEYILLS